MSSATPTNVTHIMESIAQLLKTEPYERTMEYHIHSQISEVIFENDNQDLYGILKYFIVQALASDERISLSEDNITINSWEKGTIDVSLDFYVKSFDKWYSTNVIIGGN